MPSSRTRLAPMLALALRSALLAAAVFAPNAAGAAPAGVVDLEVPRVPGAGEELWLQVRAGTLPRGATIQVASGDGTVLGTVSSFGAPRPGAAANASYTIPLPRS